MATIILLTSFCCSQQRPANGPGAARAGEPLRGLAAAAIAPSAGRDYLGQTPPGSAARVFAPGIVSTNHHEHSSPAFSPDGTEIYWSLWRRPNRGEPQVIVFVKRENGHWSSPQAASFSGQHKDGGPVFSADGRLLYFYSRRPLAAETGDESAANHIWVMERTETGWSEPKSIVFGNHLDFPGVSPSVTGAGRLYFSIMEGVGHQTGIYRADGADGRYSEPEALGETVNSPDFNWTPFIARDESYLIFSSDRPGQRGNGDLYISFRRNDGSWTGPQNMGREVNTAHQERFPSVTPDGRFLFFTRSGDDDHDDIFWINAEIIEQLRAEAEKTPPRMRTRDESRGIMH